MKYQVQMRTRVQSLFAVAMLLAVASCGGGDTQEAGDGDGVWRVAIADQVGSEVDYAAVWIAEEQGYFADRNIELERNTYENGAEAMLHFAQGDVDAVMGGIVPFAISEAQGQDFVMLMSLTKGNAPIVSTKDVTSLQDLDGGKIGSPGVGSVQDAVLLHTMKEAGISAQRVFAGVTDFIPLLDRGEIDAFIGWEPATALAVTQEPNFHYLQQMPLLPNSESLELIVRRDLAEEDPDRTAAFVEAVLEGIKYLEENPEESAKFIAQKMQSPEKLDAVKTAFESVDLTDPRVDMPSTGVILQIGAESGKLPGVDVSTPEKLEEFMSGFLDYSYLEQAEKKLESS